MPRISRQKIYKILPIVRPEFQGYKMYKIGAKYYQSMPRISRLKIYKIYGKILPYSTL
jgi:hypothetical protein